MLILHTSTSISKTAKAWLAALLLLAPVAMEAQSPGKRFIATPDTTALFRGVAVSVDVVGIVQRAVSDYGQYEAAVRVNLRDKYFPIVEVGYGSADADDPTTRLTYKTSAPYARAGVDFNLMKNKHDIYRVYAGFRYAFTSFKYDITSPGVIDPVWGGTAPFGAEDEKDSYHWLEGVAGVDAKIAGPLRIGWSVRYRRRMLHSEGDMGNVWYVPGFGKQGKSRLGGTFNVIFEL